MLSLSKNCQQCHKPMNGGVYRSPSVCPHCAFDQAEAMRPKQKQTAAQPEATSKLAVEPAPHTEVSANKQPLNKSVTAAPKQLLKAQTAPASKTTEHQTTAPKTSTHKITLTTEPSHELDIITLFEEVSATCVLHLELTPDLFIDGKFAGTKNPKVQAALKQGKKDALSQIRLEAKTLGANVVADIAIKNGMKLIDQTGANITVSVSGTAVLTDATHNAETA